MGSQRDRYDLVTEQQQIIPNFCPISDLVQNAQFPSKFHLSCLGQTSSHDSSWGRTISFTDMVIVGTALCVGGSSQ